MWHEARRVEKQLRGMMVNFKKRAERRRAFYSRMKQDPIQLLRVYGHKCKIHIDAQVAAAAEHRSVMMPWQGQADNMIDRFDGRANLDFIPTTSSELAAGPLMETDPEQNRLNYERYKSLVMIGYSGVSEEDYLQQLAAEEMIPKKEPQSFDKKEKSAAKATIGYSYGDSSVPAGTTGGDDSNDSDDESDAESIPSDIDVTVDVDELSKQEMHEIDNVSMNYGMAPAQFCRKLKVDKVEAEEQKKIKEEEEERALMGGRRSRKDRRSARERLRHHNVKDSPPSYARRSSPTYEPYRSGSSSSSSRSCSPENAGQVEFITEFGATDDKPGSRADKITHSSLSRNKGQEHNSEKRQLNRSHERSKRQRSRSRDRRRSRSRSRSLGRRRSRGRSSSRNRNRSRDRSRSSSRNRNRSRDRSRSSSRDRYRIRERSRSSSRDRLRRKSRSRSSSRGRDRYRDDRNRESRESLRAKDTAKATAKLTGLSKDKKPVGDSKDKSKLTPQEKMKRRMQLLLNKQLKVDRKDERTKRDAKERERLNREDDLREMQKKWREGRRSPSPRSWSRRSRSRSPERSRHHSDTESPARPVPIVDFDQETRDEEVIHYVYDN